MMLIVEVQASKYPVKPAGASVIQVDLNLTLWETHVLVLIYFNPGFVYMVSYKLDREVTLGPEGNASSKEWVVKLAKNHEDPKVMYQATTPLE